MNGIQYHLADGHELSAAPTLYQLKHLLLSLFQNRVQGFHTAIAETADLVIYADQSSQKRFFRHNFCILVGISGRRQIIQNLPHKSHIADLLRNLLGPQTILQRNQIHRLILIEQLYHGVKDNAILFLIKIFPCNNFGGL